MSYQPPNPVRTAASMRGKACEEVLRKYRLGFRTWPIPVVRVMSARQYVDRFGWREPVNQ
jgi:hypothetical protein